MAYYQFTAEDGTKYGSFEVLYWDQGECGVGWFWHACFPGCLPDSDPFGPFETMKEAIMDADPDRQPPHSNREFLLIRYTRNGCPALDYEDVCGHPEECADSGGCHNLSRGDN